MSCPLVLDLAADGIPVAVACRVLRFSKQAFFKWRAAPVSRRDWDDAHLTNAAIDAHLDDPPFGYRFLADEVPRRRGSGCWPRRLGSADLAAVLAAGDLVRVRQEARPDPETRPAGA